MSIYKVVTPGNESGKIFVGYAPSEGAAKKIRREFMGRFGLKMDEVTYKPVDIKTGKAGIIDYLNAHHCELPADFRPVVAVAEKAPAKKAAKKPAKKK